MKPNKTMVIMVYVMLAGVFLNAALDLYLLSKDIIPIDGENAGTFSIFSSAAVFSAYQVWLMILSVFTGISFRFRSKSLFLISVLLLLILFVYPKLTQTM